MMKLFSIFLKGRGLCLYLLWALCGDSLAQPTLRFEYITYEDGLSEFSTTVIMQDSRGFMWFGTYNGLNRYDGYKIKQYLNVPDDTTSLSGNMIWALCEDKDGIIWIGTANGLNRYYPSKETFVQYFHDEQNDKSLSNTWISSMLLDYSGNLWIGTTHGLNRYDRENESFIRYKLDPNDPKNLMGNKIWRIYEDHHRTLWIRTGGGLNQYDAKTDAFVQYPYRSDDPKKSAFKFFSGFGDLILDNNDQFWVGTGKGLFYLDPKQGGNLFKHHQFDHSDPYSLSHDNVYSLFIDSEKRLWVGTDGGGLNLFDRERDRFYRFLPDHNNPNSLSDDVILSIYEDKQGNWAYLMEAPGIMFKN